MTKAEAEKIIAAFCKWFIMENGWSVRDIAVDGRGLLMIKYLYDALGMYFGDTVVSAKVTTLSNNELSLDGGHAMTHFYKFCFLSD